jgi:hypothetical protein
MPGRMLHAAASVLFVVWTVLPLVQALSLPARWLALRLSLLALSERGAAFRAGGIPVALGHLRGSSDLCEYGAAERRQAEEGCGEKHPSMVCHDLFSSVLGKRSHLPSR